MFAIEVSDLSKKYSSGAHALKGINFRVKSGDFFALLGPNGAGKSTLIGVLSSLVIKSSGKVVINGFDLDRDSLQVRAFLGLVPQEFNLNFFETVFNVLINQAGYYGVPKKLAQYRAEKYLKLLTLWDERHEIVRNLSGGMKRRLMIVRALIHEPPILILDEPTAGVDVELRKFIWSFLEELNVEGKKTIILTTHYLEEVERLCHNVAIINKGEVVSNSSLGDLVGKLPNQSYILSLKEKLSFSAKLELEKLSYNIKILEDNIIEASLDKGSLISSLFQDLGRYSVRVKTIRAKENLIESAFFHVTNNKVIGDDN